MMKSIDLEGLKSDFTLGNYLKFVRENNDYTIKNLEDETHIPSDRIEAFENNEELPSSHECSLLSNLFVINEHFFNIKEGFIVDESYGDNDNKSCYTISEIKKFNTLSKIDKHTYYVKARAYTDMITKIDSNFKNIFSNTVNILRNVVKKTDCSNQDEKEFLQHISIDIRRIFNLNEKGPIILESTEDKGILEALNNNKPLEYLINTFPYVDFADLGNNFSGFSIFSSENNTKEETYQLIVLNINDSYPRQVFTFFREIGHIVLNNYFLAKEYSEDKIEDALDILANYILFPFQDVNYFLNDFKYEIFDLYENLFRYVSRKYCIDYTAIVCGMYNNDIINLEEKDSLIKFFSDNSLEHNYFGSSLKENLFLDDLVNFSINNEIFTRLDYAFYVRGLDLDKEYS